MNGRPNFDVRVSATPARTKPSTSLTSRNRSMRASEMALGRSRIHGPILLRQHRALVVGRVDERLLESLRQDAGAPSSLFGGHDDEAGNLRVDAMHRAGIDFLAGTVAEVDVNRLVEGEAGGLLRELARRSRRRPRSCAPVLLALRHSHRDDRAADARDSMRPAIARRAGGAVVAVAAASTSDSATHDAVGRSGPAVNAVASRASFRTSIRARTPPASAPPPSQPACATR